MDDYPEIPTPDDSPEAKMRQVKERLAVCDRNVFRLSVDIQLMASAIRRLRKMHSRLPDFETLVGERITEYTRSLVTWREHRTALRSELDALKKETSWNKHH